MAPAEPDDFHGGIPRPSFLDVVPGAAALGVVMMVVLGAGMASVGEPVAVVLGASLVAFGIVGGTSLAMRWTEEAQRCRRGRRPFLDRTAGTTWAVLESSRSGRVVGRDSLLIFAGATVGCGVLVVGAHPVEGVVLLAMGLMGGIALVVRARRAGLEGIWLATEGLAFREIGVERFVRWADLAQVGQLWGAPGHVLVCTQSPGPPRPAFGPAGVHPDDPSSAFFVRMQRLPLDAAAFVRLVEQCQAATRATGRQLTPEQMLEIAAREAGNAAGTR